jgi:hypothetical protein
MFSSRGLGLLGLGISFLGTLGMLWGGLEAFIRVEPKVEGDPTGLHVRFGDTEPPALMMGNSKLVFVQHDDARWHILANKLGKGVLAAGFVIQFIALYIDP